MNRFLLFLAVAIAASCGPGLVDKAGKAPVCQKPLANACQQEDP